MNRSASEPGLSLQECVQQKFARGWESEGMNKAPVTLRTQLNSDNGNFFLPNQQILIESQPR